MSLFGKVFGKPSAGAGAATNEEDDAEVERLLQQVAEARHAEDRRDAMAQLSSLLPDNPRAQYAISAMGLPVLLSVLAEDRDDMELTKGALEVLHASMALPEGASTGGMQQEPDAPPPPALINADLFCRAPDNVLLLLGLLRPEPEGCEDFYVRYGALQTLGALMRACPDKLQACVLSSPLGVIALMDLLSQPMEVLRNEALLLLVGLCNGCPQIANIAAFEGAFDKLLAICGAEGGPGGGDVIVQDAAELINNLLRNNMANQRLFREMGHINQLPGLLTFTPPPPPQPSAAAGIFSSASQYMPDHPSLRAAAGAAANAAANSAVGAAAAAAVAAAGAAAAAWPVQVAANYLCLLETARVLLAAPHSSSEAEKAQEEANRRANQDKLGQLGLLPLLVALSIPGAPSAAVRAQALFCIGDLVWGHAQLQEQLAGQLAGPAHSAVAGLGGKAAAAAQPIPYLQAVLRVMLHSSDDLERSGASHVLAAFCQNNNLGQMAVLSTLVFAASPQSFGEELLAALLCQQQPHSAAAAGGLGPASPSKGAHGGLIPQPPGAGIINGITASSSASGPQQQQLEQQLAAGRAAMALSFLLQQNPAAQLQVLALQVPAAESASSGPLAVIPGPPGGPGGVGFNGSGTEPLMQRVMKLLQEGTRRADGRALPMCYGLLRLLIAWCSGCSAAVSALLSGNASHLPLLVDLVGRRVASGDVHTAGLSAVLLGVCLINAPGSPMQQQQQQQQPGVHMPAPPGGLSFDQMLDVLLSRVGLSQFYGAIDEMKGSAAFQAARAAPRLPAHITRSMAAALLEAEAAGVSSAAAAAAAAVKQGGGAAAGLMGGALGLLSSAADGGAAGAAAAAAAAAQQASAEVQPYDQAFARQAEEVAAAVQQLTLNAFSAGGGSITPTPSPGIAPQSTQQHMQQQQQQAGASPLPSKPGSPPRVFVPMGAPGVVGGAAVAGVIGAPSKLGQHQQHALPIPGPPQFLPHLPPVVPMHAQQQQHAQQPPLVPLAQQQLQGQALQQQPHEQQPSPLLPHHQQQQQPLQQPQQQPPQQQQQQQLVIPEGPLSAVAAQLQGDTFDAKLLAALEAIVNLQGQVEELRSRNRSLAEDLIRVSQSKPGLAGGAGGPTANGGSGSGGTANGGAAHEGGGLEADVDARVAAQLRASRAEMEAGALKQQLSSMQERWSALEADAAAAREAAEEAKAAAGKAEADLADLSSAYNDLEAHAFSMEEQLKQLQEAGGQDSQQQQQQGGVSGVSGVSGGGLSEAEVEARINAALEQDRQLRKPSSLSPAAAADANGGPAAGGDGADDLQARIDAAVSEARAAAEAEAGEEMEDLLACLGEEQAKVDVLSGRLAELGEDVDALLATVAVEAGEDGEEVGAEEELL